MASYTHIPSAVPAQTHVFSIGPHWFSVFQINLLSEILWKNGHIRFLNVKTIFFNQEEHKEF